MMKLSLILLPIAFGLLTQPIILAAQTNAIAVSVTTQVDSKECGLNKIQN